MLRKHGPLGDDFATGDSAYCVAAPVQKVQSLTELNSALRRRIGLSFSQLQTESGDEQEDLVSLGANASYGASIGARNNKDVYFQNATFLLVESIGDDPHCDFLLVLKSSSIQMNQANFELSVDYVLSILRIIYSLCLCV